MFKFGSEFGVRSSEFGVAGEFDFVVEYDESGGVRPTMVTAIREQLGLRLQRGRAPIDALVIERAVFPSAN